MTPFSPSPSPYTHHLNLTGSTRISHVVLATPGGGVRNTGPRGRRRALTRNPGSAPSCDCLHSACISIPCIILRCRNATVHAAAESETAGPEDRDNKPSERRWAPVAARQIETDLLQHPVAACASPRLQTDFKIYSDTRKTTDTSPYFCKWLGTEVP